MAQWKCFSRPLKLKRGGTPLCLNGKSSENVRISEYIAADKLLPLARVFLFPSSEPGPKDLSFLFSRYPRGTLTAFLHFYLSLIFLPFSYFAFWEVHTWADRNCNGKRKVTGGTNAGIHRGATCRWIIKMATEPRQPLGNGIFYFGEQISIPRCEIAAHHHLFLFASVYFNPLTA